MKMPKWDIWLILFTKEIPEKGLALPTNLCTFAYRLKIDNFGKERIFKIFGQI